MSNRLKGLEYSSSVALNIFILLEVQHTGHILRISWDVLDPNIHQ